MIELFFIAAFASGLGTIVGFGGGIFVVPSMILFFSVPIEIAVGVTAFSLFPSSLLSSIFNIKRGLVDFKLALSLEIPTLLGAVLGASLTGLLPQAPLQIFFACFLLLVAYKTIKPPSAKSGFTHFVQKLNSTKPVFEAGHHPIGLWASGFFGILAGGIAGLFGIGGGVLKTPLMIHVFKTPVKVATSTGLFMICFTSLASGLTHLQLGHIDWNLFIPTASGFLTGALLGNLVGFRMKDQNLKKLIALSISFAALAIFVRAFWGI